MKHFNLKSTKAFTLIETLVAISILMVAIAGPLNIAEKGLVAAVNSRDEVVASYLAQDLLEYVKNVRDDNTLAARPWLTGLTSCESAVCTAETATDNPNAPSITAWTGAGQQACNFTAINVVLAASCRLYIDALNNPGGYYTYISTTPNQATQFYRTFTITSLGDGNSALLTSSVYWANGTILNKVVLQTIIFNKLR